MPRFEDLRLVRGQGRYTDDVSVEGQAYAVVRALAARACRRCVDRRRRRRARLPGVLAVLTGPALSRRRPRRHVRIPQSGRCHRRSPVLVHRRRRSARSSTSRNCRSRSTACAMSARRSRWWSPRRSSAARDAAEAVAVEYEVLPAVTDVRGSAGATARRRSGRTRPTISRSTMRSATAPRSRRDARPRMSWSSRPSAASAPSARFMEPRSAIGSYDAATRPIHADLGLPGRASACGIRWPRCLKVPQEHVRVDLSGCRRRLRIAHQSLSRAGRGGLGGASCRPPGEMDRRPHRGVPHRLYGARRRHQGAARASTARAASWRSRSS